jgi:magnesium transporter
VRSDIRVFVFLLILLRNTDWIAHGILDSIVDQFFPLLNSIEQEVKDLDDLVLSINGPLRNRRELGNKALPNRSITKPVEKGVEKVIILDTNGKSQMELSTFNDEVPKWSHRCVRPFVWVTRTIIHSLASTSAGSKLKQWSKLWRRKEPASPFPLVRMASTRKLVTSLTRLLGTKSEVVSQIRKRLTGSGLMGSYAISSEQALAGEVGIYLGDTQGFLPSYVLLSRHFLIYMPCTDHILALQQSLGHYERTLSHSHPAYLSHLRVAFAQATARMDHKLFYLSLISVTIIVSQCITYVVPDAT